LLLGARNICLAEAEGKDIITLCNGCANTLRGVNYQLKNDKAKKSRINVELAKIKREYQGSIEIKHFADVLKRDIGINSIKTLIEKPLTSLKVACHPGCHYMRPTEWMESDDPTNPKNLKELVNASGAEAINYNGESLCCGSATMTHSGCTEVGITMLKNKFDLINIVNADVIYVHCPSCFQQFDTNQRGFNKRFGVKYKIPVLYLTELLALAMGFNHKDLGLKFLRVRLTQILEEFDLFK